MKSLLGGGALVLVMAAGAWSSDAVSGPDRPERPGQHQQDKADRKADKHAGKHAGKHADEVGRTRAQVTLRWHVQRGDIVFPKSVTPTRMKENFEIFDFELSDEQVTRIDGLDKGEDGRQGPNPDTFDMIPD